MTKQAERAAALRACGLVEGGADAAFERLARLLVGATRAPMCVLAFGDEPLTLIKACAGPPELSPVEVLSPALYARLLAGKEDAAADGPAAGAVVRAPSGLAIGVWCARTDSPRVWTEDALDVLKDIARLTESELHLREARRPDEQTAKILECISDACVFLDKDFRYTYVNGKAGQMFGRDARELVGRHIWTEFPEGVGQSFDLAYREALRSQQPAFIEEYYPPWKRWFENRIYPSPDGLAIFFQDITAKKLAEESGERDALVREQVERMAHIGYWVWSIPDNRVRWSPELHRIYGIEPEAFRASFDAYLERLHPVDKARVQATVEQTLRTRSSVTFEERIVRPTGEIRYLHSWACVSSGPDGQPKEMFGACLDTTDFTLTTENLRRTGEWLDTAVQAARLALFEWNVRTNVVRWSVGAAAVLSATEARLGESFDAYLAHVQEGDRRAVVEGLRAAVAACRDIDLEHRIAVGTAVRWLAVRGSVFADAGGRAARLVGTILDVTSRHEAEGERRALQEQLQHAHKMEAIGRLSAGVAHDFNNLFALVRGSADLLRLKADLGADVRESIETIDQAIQQATALTKQLLAFGRRQQPSFVSVELNGVVESTCGTLRRLLPPDVVLALSLEPPGAVVLADRSQLEQVLLNLILNARDAMPSGGTVHITVRRDDGQAVLEVRDTGEGMTEEVRSRVFEPYFTTKDGRGNGIGLATVYAIVTGSHGTIDVKSEPGAGATFTVRLPLTDLAV